MWDFGLCQNGTDRGQANFIQEITGHECEVQDTGLSFFRFLIPNDEVLQDHETAPLFQDEPTEICFFPLVSVGASIVTYLCEGGKTRAVNVFARHLSDKANDRGKTQPSLTQTTLTKTYCRFKDHEGATA